MSNKIKQEYSLKCPRGTGIYEKEQHVDVKQIQIYKLDLIYKAYI
jgi:hypothetical protein